MKTSEHYNLPKVNEGGSISKKLAIQIAKELGADVKDYRSIYVGHWCLHITAHQGVHKKLQKEFRVR